MLNSDFFFPQSSGKEDVPTFFLFLFIFIFFSLRWPRSSSVTNLNLKSIQYLVCPLCAFKRAPVLGFSKLLCWGLSSISRPSDNLFAGDCYLGLHVLDH